MRVHALTLWVATSVFIPYMACAGATPANDGFVTDDAHLLTSSQEATLEKTLQDYQSTTSNEIAVLTVPSLSGADIAQWNVEIFRKWGIGGKEKNNGILLTIAYADRQINITTGYGLEGAVPDIVAKGIIDQDMNPRFKKGDYYQGIAAAVDALEKHIGGEYTASRYDRQSSSFASWVFFFFIFLNWIAAYLARSKSWWAGGIVGAVFGIILTLVYAWWVSIPLLVIIGLIFDYIASRIGPRMRGRRSGTGGWSGGGGGGLGGGGFGGGSTGGGGASGSF